MKGIEYIFRYFYHIIITYDFARILKKNAVADPGFSPGGAPTPKIAIIFQIFAENCMKMKEFGPREGASLAPPWIRQ